MIEWPFVASCFLGKPRWFRRSLQASLLVQSISYVLLFGWYWAASSTSLYTRTRLVGPAELSLPSSVVVYYIDPEDGHVRRRPLVGGEAETVVALGSTHWRDDLLIQPRTGDSNRLDLIARVGDHLSPTIVEVHTNLAVLPAVVDATGLPPLPGDPVWADLVTEVPALGEATQSPWHFRVGSRAFQGLHGSHAGTGEERGLSYETLFGAFTVRHATLLPGDVVLFQLGADQICAYDPSNSRVAPLWRGHSPLPVIPHPVR
ncbi:MAG: hypothetical protein H7A46_16290 [Verrucomicrobiales bacterium]|nr:hypothetical protein [Verrucomicrobiales bacterium]